MSFQEVRDLPRRQELFEENKRLREANRRLQVEGPALERDKLVIALREQIGTLRAQINEVMVACPGCRGQQLKRQCPVCEDLGVVLRCRERLSLAERAIYYLRNNPSGNEKAGVIVQAWDAAVKREEEGHR